MVILAAFFGFLAITTHISKKQLGLKSAWPAYLAAFFLTLGFQKIVSLIKHKIASFEIEKDFNDASFNYYSTSEDGKFSLHGDHVRIENNFSEKTQYIQSELLQSALIENNFGSMRVCFDKAQFDSQGFTIEVNNNVGKTTLYLPGNIYLDNQLDVFFGSVEIITI